MAFLAESESMVIRAQSGPQQMFLSSPADIVCFGGKAYGGKTYGLLMEPLRHIGVPRFGAVIFRRTYPQITQEGGMWDVSHELYPLFGGRPREDILDWSFPNDVRIKFAHLQHDKDMHDWDGAQIPLLEIDQAEHFNFRPVFYLLGRNRSTCGIRPYARFTCNPDPDSWLREFLAWWIDDDTGLAIQERSGVIRYFVMDGDSVVWGDDPVALEKAHGQPSLSFTFIPASSEDNVIGLAKDPGYMAKLHNLPLVDRARLLDGNWNMRELAGMFFKEHWMPVVDAAPATMRRVRAWDLAATTEKESGKAAFTAGVMLGKDDQKRCYAEDCVRLRGSPGEIERVLLATAERDKREHGDVSIIIPQDPGQAGKAQKQRLAGLLAGFNVRFVVETGSKEVRAKGHSAQAEAGNFFVVAGRWNNPYVAEHVAFPEGKYKDQVDATSTGFHALSRARAGIF